MANKKKEKRKENDCSIQRKRWGGQRNEEEDGEI